MAKKKEQEKKDIKKISEKEMESIVVDLAKKGMTNEKIGLVLKKDYGIPTTKIYGKRIGKILKENGIENNPDLINLRKKTEKLEKHMVKNKHDYKARISFVIKNAKINALKK